MAIPKTHTVDSQRTLVPTMQTQTQTQTHTQTVREVPPSSPSSLTSSSAPSQSQTQSQDAATNSRAAPTPSGPVDLAQSHVRTSDEILAFLQTDGQRGLAMEEVTRRQAKYGPNRLRPPVRPSPWKLLGRQILNAMTLVLIAAMAVSFGTQDWIAAGVIAALVILNVGTGFSQEWKAEKTVAALASVGAPVAVVLRHDASGPKEIQVDTEQVVPGDIILLSPGSIIAADARLLDGHVSNLETDEALLTGESLPVAKDPASLEKADVPLGDRINMVYGGSQVSKGRARAVVTTTGMDTELGKIATAIETKVGPEGAGWSARWWKIKVALGVAGTTPLQIKLNKIAYLLLACACVLAIVVVASTAFKDIDPSIATYAVATAVSILPASLIAVVSLTLATASRELAKRNALVRRMDAIEGLSIVTDICSDKTGTLTLGKMVAKKVWVPASAEGTPDIATGQVYSVASGSDPYYPHGSVKPVLAQSQDGKVTFDEKHTSATNNDNTSSDEDDDDALDLEHLEPHLGDFARCASLCNMATIHKDNDSWKANGDATEIALQVFAHKLHLGKPSLTKQQRHHAIPTSLEQHLNGGHYEIVIEHPFDSTVKRMSTVWQLTSDDSQKLVYLKGAVERVLDRCTHVGLQQESMLDENAKNKILEKMEMLAAEGLRVLCLSGKIIKNDSQTIKNTPRDELESGMCFLGLAGIYDPPRPESRTAVMEAARAGIVTRMLTGDHPATARAIAKSVAIIDDSCPSWAIMTGSQFDKLSEAEIDALEELPLVIARCAPETKVRLVDALHRRKTAYNMKHFVVMSGDGVNDSPSLKRADVGVAMGMAGSDVAKSVSDIVLSDDNFATITRAIRKGRSTLMNLSKFLLYLLSGNVAEIVVLMIGLAFKNEAGVSSYPLSPVAALWINTIAAGPPALALGLEPTAKDAMIKKPLAFKTIFTLWWFIDLAFYGFIMGALSLTSFVIVAYGRGNGDLGLDCNEGAYNSSCNLLFKGRGTCFATLCFILMLHGIVCKDVEKSIFQMNLLDNRFLLYAVVSLSLTVFPIIYIPRISDYAFQVVGLGWEWGLVFGFTLAFLVIVEVYKLTKRLIIERGKSPEERVRSQEKDFPTVSTIAPTEI